MECTENPGETPATMRLFPSIVCDGDLEVRWYSISRVAFACLMLLPLTFFFFAAAVAASHAHYMRPSTPDGAAVNFLRTYSFLFQRFTVDRSGFGVVYLLRPTLLALAPLISRIVAEAQSQQAWQVGFALLVLCVYAVLQCAAQPWQSKSLNLVDAVITWGTAMHIFDLLARAFVFWLNEGIIFLGRS